MTDAKMYEYMTIQETDGDVVLFFRPDGKVDEFEDKRTLPRLLTDYGRGGWRVIHRSPETATNWPMTMLEREVATGETTGETTSDD